eukprot:gnl/TRDRNA2_/TRDRNA2_195408_c0_seq1.p1 gnl/TRDRNA2_/TRDRNA2_195408_c0~~gnl/TRDRNA2_/TRDRNA2_195408_c0_seq1.p1  ORF type:complete len:361 (-),score=18.11 gnl/TRDRNA2_/TRDRNA2_195408_c0_seq1:54-1136(-)
MPMRSCCIFCLCVVACPAHGFQDEIIYDDEGEVCTSHLQNGEDACSNVQISHGVKRSSRVKSRHTTHRHRVAWVHLPKCGTSFFSTLVGYAFTGLLPAGFSAEFEMAGSGSVRVPMGLSRQMSIWPTLSSGQDMYWGEHRPITDEVYEQWKGDLFGLFRDPTSRAMSSWQMVLDNPAYDGRACMSPAAFGAAIEGTITKQLAGQAYGCLPCLSCPNNTYVVPNTALAISRLYDFKFIGLTEEYDLSICLFHAMFGGECVPEEFSHLRAGNYTTEEASPFSKYSDVYDALVYQQAAKIFWERVKEHHVTRTTCSTTFCPLAKDQFSIANVSLADLTHLAGPGTPASYEYDWPGRKRVPLKA